MINSIDKLSYLEDKKKHVNVIKLFPYLLRFLSVLFYRGSTACELNPNGSNKVKRQREWNANQANRCVEIYDASKCRFVRSTELK